MSSENKVEVKTEPVDIDTRLKDIKSLDDIDLNNIELIRGKTPKDIDEKCLVLCKDYLGCNWSQQTTKSIQVRRITGGLCNQIYYWRIREPNPNESVPQEVAIRFYGQHVDPKETDRIRDTVISLVFSEKQMGPKIYGLFEGGQIQQYYKHRQFKGEDQKNDKLVEKVFRSLARIHSWSLPLKRNKNYLLEMTDQSLEISFKKLPINEMIDEYNCETLKKYDLKTEFQWIKTIIESSDSPVLFTHNDYRSSNIMITEPNDELVVCDYDISGYGYRGYDFVSLMKDWGRNQFDFKTIDGIPLGSEFRPYIEIYVDECEQIYGKSYSQNAINSVEHILKELKIFLLFSYLFFTILCLRGHPEEQQKKKVDKEEEPPNYKLLMDFAEVNYKNCYAIK